MFLLAPHSTLNTSTSSLPPTSPVFLSSSSPKPDLLSTDPLIHCEDPRRVGTSTEFHSSTQKSRPARNLVSVTVNWSPTVPSLSSSQSPGKLTANCSTLDSFGTGKPAAMDSNKNNESDSEMWHVNTDTSHLVPCFACVCAPISIPAIFFCIVFCCGSDRSVSLEISSCKWRLMTVRKEKDGKRGKGIDGCGRTSGRGHHY